MTRLTAIILWVVLACITVTTRAAIPLLERSVTITLEQERVDIALRKIAQQGDFTFSYNPSIVDVSRLVSFTFAGNTVREVLDKLFQGAINYKVRNNYIILTKASAPTTEAVYSGYIVDEATGARLKNVSVYDPISLSSAITDEYGYFQLEVNQPTASEVKLAINKRNYGDTVIYVSPTRDRLLRVPIAIDEERFDTIADSVSQKFRRFWRATVSTLQAENIQNVQDTIYRTTQVSVLPFIGTNHRMSANVINDYSFNIFGGYALGVKKSEVGTFFNVDRGYVKGTQMAGLFNVVGGKMEALQFAGLVNVDIDSVKRPHFAGLVNLDLNSTSRFAAAGLLNVVYRDARNAQFAGIGNVTIGDQRGASLAGLFNVTTRAVSGAQVAGLFSFTRGEVTGAQVSGLLNFGGRNIRGTQASGLLNVAPGTLRGAQVSGFVNYATRITGAQVGVLNIADSIKGIPIGFLSVVRKGYHQIEVSADEVFYTNVAFRTGVPYFYNIIAAGAQPSTFGKDNTVWSFGYGVGTAPKINRWLSLNIDATAHQIMNGDRLDGVNLLNRVYTGVEFRAAPKIGFTVGVTLNAYYTDPETMPTDLFADYTPHYLYEKTYSNDVNVKMWLGGKIGVRFF